MHSPILPSLQVGSRYDRRRSASAPSLSSSASKSSSTASTRDTSQKRVYDLLEPGGLAIISTPYHGYLKNLALAASGKLDSSFHRPMGRRPHQVLVRCHFAKVARGGRLFSHSFLLRGALPAAGKVNDCPGVSLKRLSSDVWLKRHLRLSLGGKFSGRRLNSSRPGRRCIDAGRTERACGGMRIGDAALGHRRLSILDLSERASQPMISDDGRLVVVFNGEIYNYPDYVRSSRPKA